MHMRSEQKPGLSNTRFIDFAAWVTPELRMRLPLGWGPWERKQRDHCFGSDPDTPSTNQFIVEIA